MPQNPEIWYLNRLTNRLVIYGAGAAIALAKVAAIALQLGSGVKFGLSALIGALIFLSVYDSDELWIAHKIWRSLWPTSILFGLCAGLFLFVPSAVLADVLISLVCAAYFCSVALSLRKLMNEPGRYASLFDILNARSPRRL